ncbi:hypothetical protein Pmani_029673 [Petrolisthes manimaculis]|uniref:Uncharacterized protein n=1 Tax=Petrolisthes manimaculis TaxID=1843537 RepID=A0AAE1NX50_9EUCA|nr:hypothetical protein Pmani_029673 [Petrolisthes manimaculis]
MRLASSQTAWRPTIRYPTSGHSMLATATASLHPSPTAPLLQAKPSSSTPPSPATPLRPPDLRVSNLGPSPGALRANHTTRGRQAREEEEDYDEEDRQVRRRRRKSVRSEGLLEEA